MRRTLYLLLAGLCAAVLSACAVGPGYHEAAASFPPLAKDHGRIFFLRENTMIGSALQPDIYLNGMVVGRSVAGGFFFVDELPGTYTVRTSVLITEKISFELAAGETRYIRTQPKPGLLLGRVEPALEWPDGALAAMKELKYAGGVTPTQPEAHPAVARTASVNTAPRSVEDVRTTSPGTSVLLSSHATWDKQCQSRFVPDIEVRQAPLHGRIEVKEGDFVLGQSGGQACAGRIVHGALVYYAPQPDFQGVDTARYVSGGSPDVVKIVKIEVGGNGQGRVTN